LAGGGNQGTVSAWKHRDSFDLETQGQFQPGSTGTVQLENLRRFQLGKPRGTFQPGNPQVVIGD